MSLSSTLKLARTIRLRTNGLTYRRPWYHGHTIHLILWTDLMNRLLSTLIVRPHKALDSMREPYRLILCLLIIVPTIEMIGKGPILTGVGLTLLFAMLISRWWYLTVDHKD